MHQEALKAMSDPKMSVSYDDEPEDDQEQNEVCLSSFHYFGFSEVGGVGGASVLY